MENIRAVHVHHGNKVLNGKLHSQEFIFESKYDINK